MVVQVDHGAYKSMRIDETNTLLGTIPISVSLCNQTLLTRKQKKKQYWQVDKIIRRLFENLISMTSGVLNFELTESRARGKVASQ